MAGDPLPGPVLCPLLRCPVGHRRQIVEPAKAVQFGGETRIGGRDIPDRGFRRIQKMPRNHKTPGADLLSERGASDTARLWLQGEFRGRKGQSGPARRDAVSRAHPTRRQGFTSEHGHRQGSRVGLAEA